MPDAVFATNSRITVKSQRGKPLPMRVAVSASVRGPMSASVRPPVSASVQAPVSASVWAPVSASMRAPVSASVRAPVSTSVRAPGSASASASVRRPQSVRRGQLLLSGDPFVYVVKADSVRSRCCYCLESATSLQRCSGCQLYHFCNRQCQRNAWTEFHRLECRRLRAAAPRLPPDTAILLARLVQRLRAGGDRLSEPIELDLRRRRFADLMSHYSDLKTSAQRMEHIASLGPVLKALIGEENFPNASELIGLYGRICVNSFNILDAEMTPVAVGIYLAASIIDHSCAPNACATFSGRRITIRALQDFDNFSWDKVRISYVDTLADRATRRRELKAGYFFDCDCTRCRDEAFTRLETAIACGTEGCTARVDLPATSSSPSNAATASTQSPHGTAVCPPFGEQQNGSSHSSSMPVEKPSPPNGSTTLPEEQQLSPSLPHGSTTLPEQQQLSSSLPHGSTTLPEEQQLSPSLPHGSTTLPEQQQSPSLPHGSATLPEQQQSQSPRCARCGFCDFPRDVSEQVAALNSTARRLAQDSTVYYDTCLRCLEAQRRLLHPDNLHRVKVTDLTVDAAITNGLWERALELAQPLIDGYRLYYGEQHPLLGLLYLKLGKLALYRFQQAAAERYLRAGGAVLRVTHGAEHPLLRDELHPLMAQLQAEMQHR